MLQDAYLISCQNWSQGKGDYRAKLGITILGEAVNVEDEVVVVNSIVLLNKTLNVSVQEEIWEKVNGSVFGVLAAARNLLHDWREAQVSTNSSVIQELNLGLKKWRKPPDGWFKINCDASGAVHGSIGIGCVIRDSHGRFVGARCCKIDGSWHPKEAEAISLKEAISWTKSLDQQCCSFETDSKVLCKGKTGESYFHTIVSDCIQELKHIDQVLVGFVYRSANCAAHLLANAVHSMSGCGS